MSLPLPTPPLAFTATPRFRPLESLGAGAGGAVHRVHDTELGRDLALKTLLLVSPDEIYRLKQEFRAVSGVVHPNLIRLHELFVEGGQCFFTMDLIEGLHLDEYVRGTSARPRSSGVRASAAAQRATDLPSTFRHDRFVDALRQVASGVAALHAAGRVHRDLKPSNVLVTPEGRAVVLDFGFAVPWRPEDLLSGQEEDVAGTLPYMAPEQLFSGHVRPASDLYSVGAMMFELLTGTTPFTGTVEEVFFAKSRPLPAEAVSALGTPYGPLVAALLDPAPERRPSIESLLAQLGDTAPQTDSIQDRDLPFVGRAAEMEQLRAALDDVISSREAAVVRLEGVSGMGKSELLRRFLASVSGTARAAVGRSRPQESVPYKVFDGAMDELSQELLGLPTGRREALWPEHTGPLLRLFPVLRRARGEEPEPEVDPNADPREERRFAFMALRNLLERVAADMPLIVCLDDAHWGDLDSAALLGSLLTPTLEAPVLVLLAYRAEELRTSPFLVALNELAPAETARTVRLEALSEKDTLALGEELLRGYGQSAAVDAAAFVRESAGSPFFIGELARNVAEAGAPRAEGESLDVVGARLDRLSDTERTLLETVAAAGRAIRLRTVIDAAALPGASRLDLLRLADLRWLRQTEVDLAPAVETYHDRLRERVLSRLAATPERLRDTHHRIATTLDEPGADPEILLFHYDAAGSVEAAGRAAVAAAERANRTLAFERAAELFLRAAQLRAEGHPATKLHELRGEALGNAGRALDAARAFEEAARLLVEPPTGTHRMELQRRAGENYLRTAHYDEGLAIMDEVLHSVGEAFPKSHGKALLPAAVRRIRFLVRGIEFKSREPHEVPPATRRRLEALWSAAISLALLDHQRADPIALTHLLEVLDHGDTAQALRALSYEAGVLASIGNGFLRRRSAEIQTLVNTRAEERGVPYERAWAKLAIGSSAWFCGEWRRCVDYCDQGAAIFREQCRGVSWEIASMEMFGLSALGIMGDVEELGRRLPLAIQAAEERGDLFGLNNCRLGQPSILWLAGGRVAELRSFAEKADRAMWKGGYHTHRYHYAFAVGQADLHDGDPWSCLARLEEHWSGLKEARLYYLEWLHVEMRHLRARASLLAARQIRDGAPVPPRYEHLRYEGLVRFVESEAKAIGKHRIAPALALAATLKLSLASLGGKADREPLRRAALDACRAADMRLLADLLAAPQAGTPDLRRALGILD